MDERYEKMARLAIERGVNLQKGQALVIIADVRDAEFVRLCTEQAYAAGAKFVTVRWASEEISRLGYLHQDVDTLCDVPQWKYDQEVWEQKNRACYLFIESEKPDIMAGVDPEKIGAAMRAVQEKLAPLRAYRMNNEGQWCILGVASPGWAKVVFPELPEEEAFRRLEDALFEVSLVTADNDPVADWARHDDDLARHAKIMTDYHFEALHFTNAKGTDLTVPLVNDHLWVGGGSARPDGVFFDCNIPTEEVFCMPHCERTEGIVYASRPLSANGAVIDGFWFRFEGGKVVDFGAEKEEETLRQLLEMDEGSRRLGEVALVPYDSPISKSGVLFFNTLYDENASCHLALGDCYPENLEGGAQMTPEELRRRGGNHSIQHKDFMFGTPDLCVDGILPDGTAVPVFRDGNFVF